MLRSSIIDASVKSWAVLLHLQITRRRRIFQTSIRWRKESVESGVHVEHKVLEKKIQNKEGAGAKYRNSIVREVCIAESKFLIQFHPASIPVSLVYVSVFKSTY